MAAIGSHPLRTLTPRRAQADVASSHPRPPGRRPGPLEFPPARGLRPKTTTAAYLRPAVPSRRLLDVRHADDPVGAVTKGWCTCSADPYKLRDAGMRLSRRQSRALEELRAAGSLKPSEVRRRIAEIIRDIGEADVGLWYMLAEVDGRPWLTDWQQAGFSDAAMARARRDGIPTCDPRRPRPSWSRSFLLLENIYDPPETYYQEPVYRNVLDPAGLNDQLRLLVYAGDRFVGWVGGLRRRGAPAFRRADARRLNPLAKAIASALVTADASERAVCPEESCDLLVRPDGTVDYASEAARWWLERRGSRELVERWIRRLDRREAEPQHLAGWPLRWVRLHGPEGVRYLLHLCAPSPLHVAPVDRLTSAQREVAQLAASGWTVAEMARRTQRAPETVRSHLRAVYRRLRVSSRAELARALWAERVL